MRPAVSYIEPWQWHSQPPYSPSGICGVETVGVQPRWVQTPIRISHSGLVARLASVAGAPSGSPLLLASGSGSEATSTALAASISAGVRRRTNKGWPRHLTMTCWPGCTAPSSTSVEASANAAVEGFIWSTKGQAAAVRPTAPTAPDATYRKSRRVPASLIVAATGSTLLGNLERNVELLPRTSADAVLTQRRGQYHFWAPPPFVRWASKIESRFSRVLRHDDAENA